jgi:hypothetical protein
MFIPDPCSECFPYRILDPGSRVKKIPHPGSIKEFKYFEPKNLFLSSRKYDPGCSSRIRIPDIGCIGSRIRIRNIASQAHLQRALESKTLSVNLAVILKTIPKTAHDIYIYIKADFSWI